MLDVKFVCPHCNSMNIAPTGTLWLCRDCGKSFEAASARIDGGLSAPGEPRPPRPTRKTPRRR